MEKRAPPLLPLPVTYVDVDTVIGMLNENLPKVRSKLVPQSKPKNDNNIIQQSGNLAPLPPLGGRGGGGKGGAKLCSYFSKQALHQMYPPLFV